jgi:pyruvate dehydrogenase complex dehydrogenase (E1) component
MPSCSSYNECGAYEAATVCIKGQQRMSEAQEPQYYLNQVNFDR